MIGFRNVVRNGYEETVRKGLNAVKRFSGQMSYGKGSDGERIDRLKTEIETADAIVIGAGAGLSTSAGFTYGGERFERYFFDFAQKIFFTTLVFLGFDC